jgi:hypothetical protein
MRPRITQQRGRPKYLLERKLLKLRDPVPDSSLNVLMRTPCTMKTWVRLVEECAWLPCPMRVGDDGSRGHSYRPTRDCMDVGLVMTCMPRVLGLRRDITPCIMQKGPDLVKHGSVSGQGGVMF